MFEFYEYFNNFSNNTEIEPIRLLLFFVTLQVAFSAPSIEISFGELSVEMAATPPKLTLLSNFCSATLTVSWVLDEIWPIKKFRGGLSLLNRPYLIKNPGNRQSG